MAQVFPALDVTSKEEFLKRLAVVAPHVPRVQWDVMDGIFVENTTFSDPAVLIEISKLDYKYMPKIEMDLMVSDPEKWIDRFSHPGISQLIFHVESAKNWEPILSSARALGFEVGLAADPETPLDSYLPFLATVDRFQAMGGKSGFRGQKFNPLSLENVRQVRSAFPKLPISLDIGVNLETAPAMLKAGVTILVSDTAIFGAKDPVKALESLKNVQV